MIENGAFFCSGLIFERELTRSNLFVYFYRLCFSVGSAGRRLKIEYQLKND